MPGCSSSFNRRPLEKDEQTGLERYMFTLNMPISSTTFRVPARGRSKLSCDHYKTVSGSWLLDNGTGAAEQKLTSASEVMIFFNYYFFPLSSASS